MGKPSKMGRPTKYKPEYADLVYNYCLLGATDQELAQFFEVDERTINNWKAEQPDFLQSLKHGKFTADSEVANCLYRKATGYSITERKVFMRGDKPTIVEVQKEFPPDTSSMIFWLKNRQPALWRDRHEVATTTLGNKRPEDMTADELSAATDEQLLIMLKDDPVFSAKFYPLLEEYLVEMLKGRE